MKQRSLLGIVFLAVALLVTATNVQAQGSVVEVYFHFSDMPQGVRHLYLRVIDDGQVEYEQSVFKPKADSNPEKGSISSAELSDLRKLIGSEAVRNIRSFYGADIPSAFPKFFTTLIISRKPEVQKVEMVNFNPLVRNDKGQAFFPAGLTDLMCHLVRIRGKFESRFEKEFRWCP